MAPCFRRAGLGGVTNYPFSSRTLARRLLTPDNPRLCASVANSDTKCNRPHCLLLAGVVLWVVNIAVFALAYWEVDGGGPEDRARNSGQLPDLVFPRQQADQEGLAPKGWTPSFSDYLYVSVTVATTFSPTDAMPYSS
jgi:hypothetical protein